MHAGKDVMMTDPWDVATETAKAAYGAGPVEMPNDDPCELVGMEPITKRAFRNGDIFFVRSAQRVGKWYMIREGVCSCPGFEYRHTCNHVSHLEKAGFLAFDAANGDGYRVVGDPSHGNGVHRAKTATTGVRHSLAGASSEVEARDAQVRRLQDFARAQDRLVHAHRRLLTLIRSGEGMASLSSMRLQKMVEVADREVTEMSQLLHDGDLVELQEER